MDEAIVQALKRRAARHDRSAEAEHREILRQALSAEAEGRSFKEFLLSMPDVGDDSVFERIGDSPREVEP
jgi:plasmid stability protein